LNGRTACAFDSVPADLGVLLTTRHFEPDCCNAVSSYLSLQAGPAGIAGHYTTFECAVHGLADVAELRTIRRKIAEAFDIAPLKPPGPVLVKQPMFFYEPIEKKYAMTFMGADASVVRSSQRTLRERGEYVATAPQYSAFVYVPSVFYLAAILVLGLLLQTLAGYPRGRALLLRYPRLFTAGMFSHEGPSKEQLKNTSFKMTLYGTGFSGPGGSGDTTGSTLAFNSSRKYSSEPGANQKKVVKVVVEGPEPGYVATPILLAALAQCALEERADMPPGGVLTPASAFHNSDTIFTRLSDAGIKISVLKAMKQEL
jgi:hypothetical protein